MKRYLIIYMTLLLTQLGLNGQSLEELLFEAAQNSPSLKAQYFRYSAALERIEQQNALPDPTISFGYFISPVETRVGAQNFKLSVSQMFPWMGTLKQKESLAASEAQIEFEKFQELKNELFYNVKLAYLELYLLEKEIELKEQDIEVLKSYEPITKTKYESNLVSLSDLVRVQIALDHAQADIEIMKAKRAPFTSSLNELLNHETSQSIDIQELPIITFRNEDYLDTALINHPSIIRAKSQISSAEAKIQLSDQNRKPNIGIGLDYVVVSERTDMDVANNGKDAFMPMISMSLPIFGKRNRAAEKEAQLLRNGAILQLEATENALRSAWTEKNYLQNKAKIEIDQLRREIEQTEFLLSVLLSEYSNNNRNFEEVLATQQKLLQLRIIILEAQNGQFRADYMQSYLTGSSLKEIITYENE